ncbi:MULTISPECIES: hypothetical protein [unclassified Nocardioides]|uniref:hypothetical protein n=1 Tax=unclassified Nocardioides TaxID=2615069 RepID=UPI00240513E7|nr:MULTISPECIES: hypothetical protein [unclassified Nocardioides]
MIEKRDPADLTSEERAELGTRYTYTPHKPPLAETSDELRARIPGWGADLDPADRPAVPKMRFDPGATGARWEFPERQPELRPRERSVEHAFVTPVFGTGQPLKGVSGVVRRLAYRRFSEARAAHWLLLVAADRVDVAEGRVTSALRGRPDRLVAETGVRGEAGHEPVSSRAGRVDVRHQWIDPVIVAGPMAVAGVLAYRVVRRARSAR